MRRIAWGALLLCIFTIPWEYSLDFGAPLGNIARVFGIATLLVTALAVVQAGSFRPHARVHWLIAAYFLWFCCTILWSVDRDASFEKIRGYFQECMITWLIWELGESLDSVKSILRAWVAGSLVLALLTVGNLALWDPTASQIRFFASGQDPNDTARFLDLGFPAAALLLAMSRQRFERWLGLAYFPIAALAVLATGSRGGAVAALLAWFGCGALYLQRQDRTIARWTWAVPLLVLAAWTLIPGATLARIATIANQIQGGDLNQRTAIWLWGWEAAKTSPFWGYGAGTFASAAGLTPTDTAHNTALSILVEGGAVGLCLAVAIFLESFRMVVHTAQRFRVGTGTLLAVWAVCSAVGTALESRSTWLMIGVIAVLAPAGTDCGMPGQPALSQEHSAPDRVMKTAWGKRDCEVGDEI